MLSEISWRDAKDLSDGPQFLSESMKRNPTNDIESELKGWLSNARKVAIAGVGNQLRKDDFAGVQVVRNLKGKVSRAVYLIECETVPEDFLEPIVRFEPTHVLIIDAALMGLEPGSSKLIEPNQIGGHTISTHTLPLRIFCEYLSKTTSAKIALLSIQPKDTSFGEGLTTELGVTIRRLSNILTKSLKISIEQP